MSTLSRKILSSDHSGVHEQFDVVLAALLSHQELNSQELQRTVIRSNQKKVIKDNIRNSMDGIGLRRDWLGVTLGLGQYAYEFLELIIQNENWNRQDDYDRFLLELATELDQEYSQKGSADAIGFLKRRLGFE